jgi:MFS family permease
LGENSSIGTAREARLAAMERSARDVRLLLVGNTLSALGTGFTLPFLFIYLTQVRGFHVQTAGFAIAWIGVVGFAVVPAGGALVDRIGAARVLMMALTLEGLGAFSLGFVERPWQAFAVVTVLGAGGAAGWPAQSALVASIVPSERRPRVFAIQFALLNLGIGLGGAVSGLLVDVGRVSTFQVVYAIDAASFLVYVVILVLGLRHIGPVPNESDEEGSAGSYRDVLRDKTFVRFAVLSFVLTCAGYSQVETGLPAFATGVAHVSTRVIGLGFAANTGVIVLGQLLVQRRLEGRRRNRALAGVAALWGVSWAIFGFSGLVPGGTAAAVLVISSMGLFGLGETLLAPTSPAIVNDLAPPHLRGRYNAASSLTWNTSAVVGPVLAGVLLGHDLTGAYIGMLITLCAIVVVMAIRLERHLTPEQNGRPREAGATNGTIETCDPVPLHP